MRTYHTDELLFDIPDEWTDRTMNLFVSARGDRVPFNIVITRDKFANENLEPFVVERLQEITKKLPKCKVLGQRPRKVGPLSAMESKIQWPIQGGTMYQRQVYVAYYDQVLTFTGSCILKLGPQCDAYLEQVLSSLKFRKQ